MQNASTPFIVHTGSLLSLFCLKASGIRIQGEVKHPGQWAGMRMRIPDGISFHSFNPLWIIWSFELGLKATAGPLSPPSPSIAYVIEVKSHTSHQVQTKFPISMHRDANYSEELVHSLKPPFISHCPSYEFMQLIGTKLAPHLTWTSLLGFKLQASGFDLLPEISTRIFAVITFPPHTSIPTYI